MDSVERARQVRGDNLVEFFRDEIGPGPLSDAEAGVIYEDIDPAEAPDNLVTGPGDRGSVGNVSDDAGRLAAIPADIVALLAKRICTAGRIDDRVPCIGESYADRPADPSRAAGNPGDFAVTILTRHVAFPSCWLLGRWHEASAGYCPPVACVPD